MKLLQEWDFDKFIQIRKNIIFRIFFSKIWQASKSSKTGAPGPCSCNDCPACCVIPDTPEEPQPFELFGYHGSVVIVIFGYVIFVWAFSTAVIAWHLFCVQKEKGYTNLEF